MSNFGITKTIPAGEGWEGVNGLYDGTLSEFEFHMAGSPSKLQVGHYVYTIYNNQLVGRLLRRQCRHRGRHRPAQGQDRGGQDAPGPGRRRPRGGHRRQ